MTDPLIVMGVAVVAPTLGALTVVLLGPMPNAYIWLSYALSVVKIPSEIAVPPSTLKANMFHTGFPLVRFTAI
jgi:hypothetical protein